MQTGAVASTQSQSSAIATGAAKALDRDAFLKLLITELQNQDPMNPMQDKDFIAQLAQFSSLEQMQRLNDGFAGMGKNSAASRAFEMIGKKIDYADLETGETPSGTVSGVVFEDGWPKLEIGSARIEIDRVVRVYQ